MKKLNSGLRKISQTKNHLVNASRFRRGVVDFRDVDYENPILKVGERILREGHLRAVRKAVQG